LLKIVKTLFKLNVSLTNFKHLITFFGTIDCSIILYLKPL